GGSGTDSKILRDNMHRELPSHGEFGAYFSGYSPSPRTIEQMLENMFIGRPPGNYDRILDFSTAVTGNLFFVPTSSFLDSVSPDQPVPAASPTAPVETSASTARSRNGSLGIGSLKGEHSHE